MGKVGVNRRINTCMKIFEIITPRTLLEYNHAITLDKSGMQLAKANKASTDQKLDVDQLLSFIEAGDPTRNKAYVQWLVKQYIRKEFKLSDISEIRDTLESFETLKRRLVQKDINKYTLASLRDTVAEANKVGELGAKSTKTNTAGALPVLPETEILYNGPLGQLSIPQTAEAACDLGHGGSWCTARPDSHNMFDAYAEFAPLYVWIDKSGKKYQFYFSMFDPAVTNPSMAGDPEFRNLDNTTMDDATLTYFRTQHPVISKLFKKMEPKADQLELILLWATDVVKGRWPKAEEIIARDVQTSFEYARQVIKGPFELGEPAIASDARLASYYALNIINGPFELGEPAIASNASTAYQYARFILHRRWPEAESVIAENPDVAEQYAHNVIQGPWPEAGITEI